jgi:hypothetical protein
VDARTKDVSVQFSCTTDTFTIAAEWTRKGGPVPYVSWTIYGYVDGTQWDVLKNVFAPADTKTGSQMSWMAGVLDGAYSYSIELLDSRGLPITVIDDRPQTLTCPTSA